MISYFFRILEYNIEIFMGDLLVIGDLFKDCILNLNNSLQGCKDFNRVFMQEKCHLMVKQEIIQRHNISAKGIELYQAKIKVIEKVYPPISSKGVRCFLDHVSFHQRIIQDFYKINNQLFKFLDNKSKFEFCGDFLKEFKLLKQNLVSTPIIFNLDWSQSFKVIVMRVD